MWHILRERLNLVLISEFPKSGASWYAQMMSEALNIPFPRNQSPNLESCIMHGHHLYHNRFGKMVGVVRDGRDVVVSAYYHFLFENNRNSRRSVESYRSRVGFSDFDNIRDNLPKFIDYLFQEFSSGRTHFSWSESINSFYGDSNVCIVKYEDLLSKAAEELNRTIQFLDFPIVNMDRLEEVVAKYSFKNLTKRNPGQENIKSFIRKGIAGDWKNHFSKEASLRFHAYAGDELIIAGYEKNSEWTNIE